jgi:hypothetical protein
MGKKTASSGAAGSPKKKSKSAVTAVPSVASMGQLASAAGSLPSPICETGITIEIFRYCKCASAYSDAYGGEELTLVNMACSDRPNPLFFFSKAMEMYGASTQESSLPAPMTREEIENEYNVKMVFVSKKTAGLDVDKVGWRKNGLGVYVWGGVPAVKNFLMHVDDVLDWRTTFSDDMLEPLAALPKVTVHVPAHFALELSAVDDELKCNFEIKKELSEKLTVFDVPPPTFPSRIVILTFELLSDTTAHAIFSGNTKPFQTGFGKLKIRGTSVKLQPTDEYGEFFRVREPAYNLSALTACTDELKMILGNGCLKSSPVIIRMNNATKSDTSALFALTEALQECDNIRLEL